MSGRKEELVEIGVVYPQTEIESDAASIRAYAEAVEALQFDHIIAYDHVLGVDPALHTDWDGPYDISSRFQEPMVLFGYLAGLTSLGLGTSVLVLPQRQTALVAKQAAEVDILSGGRFRLGVGVGWNRCEYDALGQDFARRGRRVEQQIKLLRRLWTERTIATSDDFDHLWGVGICPLPVQRPIPVWIGGRSEAAYRRIGRLGDGWFPNVRPGPELDAAIESVALAAREVGRVPESIGMEGRVPWTPNREAFAREVSSWRERGATHIAINTLGVGLKGVQEHIDALAAVAQDLHLGACPRNR